MKRFYTWLSVRCVYKSLIAMERGHYKAAHRHLVRAGYWRRLGEGVARADAATALCAAARKERAREVGALMLTTAMGLSMYDSHGLYGGEGRRGAWREEYECQDDLS